MASSFLPKPKLLKPDVWTTIPTMPKLRVVGSGTITIDVRDRSGNITTEKMKEVFINAGETYRYPNFGESSYQFRANFPNTLTVELN